LTRYQIKSKYFSEDKLLSDERLCPECAEVIKKAAKKCKHCGAAISSESVQDDSGVIIEFSKIFRVFILIVICWFAYKFFVNDNKTTKESLPVQTPYSIAKSHRPEDESKFIEIISEAQRQSATSQNDMQKGGIKAKRDKKLCEVMSGSREIKDWTGIIKRIDANGDGKGVLEIEIERDITLETNNNSFSDTFDNTLIEPDNPIFKIASSLQTGTPVKFNGKLLSNGFFADKNDCLEERSITLDGKVSEPEYIFRFSSIEQLTENKKILNSNFQNRQLDGTAHPQTTIDAVISSTFRDKNDSKNSEISKNDSIFKILNKTALDSCPEKITSQVKYTPQFIFDKSGRKGIVFWSNKIPELIHETIDFGTSMKDQLYDPRATKIDIQSVCIVNHDVTLEAFDNHVKCNNDLSCKIFNYVDIPQISYINNPEMSTEANTKKQVILDFYDLLSKNDIEMAQNFLISEKRNKGAFEIKKMQSFFGGMKMPIHINSIESIDDNKFNVGYQYTKNNARCNGKAVVETYLDKSNGAIYISRINANC